MRLIDADALKERAIRVSTVKEHCYMKAVGTHEIDKAPTVVPDINVGKWIPVTERLPKENEYVLIWCGSHQVAEIVIGISEEVRAAMKRGELPDPAEYCWSLTDGWKARRRSSIYGFGDVHGNNKVPYAWRADGGPMKWNGQDVTHWMPLPEPPKEVE